MNLKNKKIIIIIGEVASGKGTTGKYIAKRYNGSFYPSSVILKQILEKLEQTVNRDNYINLSTFLRTQFGDDYLVKPLSIIFKNDENNLIVLDGLRKEKEILSFKKLFDVKVIYIESSLEIRYKRLKARAEKADDAIKTFKEFKADHAKDTEKNILKFKKYADFTIINESDIVNLHKELNNIQFFN
ncbi:MAG: AAA family ATPase [Patescibacteria group bacterium]|nr:AAA family ATPase [Patescibacteria group bacterium]